PSTVTSFRYPHPPTPAPPPLSLHDALPISRAVGAHHAEHGALLHHERDALDRLDLPHELLAPAEAHERGPQRRDLLVRRAVGDRDRKSTRLNSSHRTISYAVFCLKKKKK